MKEILKIGFVGTAISPYYAEEQEVRKKSETQLKKLLENYDVELISFNKTIFSKNDSIEAENFLDIWLPKLQMDGDLVGIIIHGKGYGSGPDGPKLKNFVDQYLQYNPNVLAYHSALQKDGGTGAVYIQLKNIN